MAKKNRRESQFVTFARMAHKLAQKEFTPYSHPKSPRKYTQPQLVACILLMHRLRLSYRDMEEWLLASDAVVKELGLKDVPTYSALARAAARLLTLAQIDRMNVSLLTELGIEEEAVAIDATGFQLTQASDYYINRRGWKITQYWKGFYGVGLNTLFILGRSQSYGPGHDGSKLETMRRAVRPFMRSGQWVLLADGGFDVKSVRPDDLIPPRRTGPKRSIASPLRKARADLVAAARLDGLFGQRWKVESVISVIKRKFGDAIRARKYYLQRREPAIKMLVYNLHH
ncbi:MAG: transposase [Ardenticatenaceae bacterium]|nr:transposase [Ardenticatenaceae bacterium]MCB8947987.1 transposase [Ardenticatenaceae bacterium]MCB8949312.1 transposase [Ardenticatenaceae bacterium]